MRPLDRLLPWLLVALVPACLACDPASGPAPAKATQSVGDRIDAIDAAPEATLPAEFVRLRDPQAPAAQRPGRPLDYLHDYRFEEDWFTHNIPFWDALLASYAGRPGVRYLEIGLWEGRSFLWMLDRILTHPSARATGIDIAISATLQANLERSGAADRVTLIEGASQTELRKLPPASQDIVYIDGSHTAADVLEDMVLAWRLLESGGLMILDDYRWKGFKDPSRPALPDELLPGLAIDAFVSANRNDVEVVLKGYQMVLRKRGFACPAGESKCSSLGDYAYDWLEQKLYHAGSEVSLSNAEREIVEALIRSKQGDGLSLALAAAIHDSAEFRALNARLGLGLE